MDVVNIVPKKATAAEEVSKCSSTDYVTKFDLEFKNEEQLKTGSDTGNSISDVITSRPSSV